MRPGTLVVAAAVVACSLPQHRQDAGPHGAAPSEALLQSLNGLPLSFVPNVGQTDAHVQFQAQATGGSLAFMTDGVLLVLSGGDPATSLVGVEFVGASLATVVQGERAASGRHHFLQGSDPARWHKDVPDYAGVVYRGIHEGIDLRYEGSGARLKGTWYVAPGADPTQIRWRYTGGVVAALTAEGDIRIDWPSDPDRRLTEERPIAWQDIDGQRVPIPVVFEQDEDGSFGVDLGDYDEAEDLVVDPLIRWSTLMGGGGTDSPYAMAMDDAGDLYLTGYAHSNDLGCFPWPLKSDGWGVVQPTYGGEIGDAFVVKIRPTTPPSLVYSTHLGGGRNIYPNDPLSGRLPGRDIGRGIAVDSQGQAIVVGMTEADDFPGTSGPQAALCPGGNTATSIVASFCPLQGFHADTNFSGGSPHGTVDPATGMPMTDGFVTKLNAEGSKIVFSTYAGQVGIDVAEGVAVDDQDNIYVVGLTETTNSIPAVLQSAQPVPGLGFDGFVFQYSPSGAPLAATYVGGDGYDTLRSVKVVNGKVFVGGTTTSATLGVAPTAPPGSGPAQSTYDGPTPAPYLVANAADVQPHGDGLVAVLDAGLSQFQYLSYVSDNTGSAESVEGIDVDPFTERVFVTGGRVGIVAGVPASLQDSDIYVTAIDPFAGGGVAFDVMDGGAGDHDQPFGIAVAKDRVFVVGATTSTTIPVMNPITHPFLRSCFGAGSFSGTPSGGYDAFVFGLDANTGAPVMFSYFGGSFAEDARAVVTDGRSLFVAGATHHINCPIDGCANNPPCIPAPVPPPGTTPGPVPMSAWDLPPRHHPLWEPSLDNSAQYASASSFTCDTDLCPNTPGQCLQANGYRGEHFNGRADLMLFAIDIDRL